MGEWAVDHGGPRREFFRLFSQKAHECFFLGNFLMSNVSAMQVKL